MTKLVVGLLVGLALGSGATWLFLHDADEHPAAKTEAAGAKPETKPNPLMLPAEKREAAGIRVVKVAKASITPEVQGFGRVLDPTSLATGIGELATARAALDASEKELARAQKLFGAGGNASAQAVETATANAARDRATVASAQARLTAAWGREIAGNVSKLAAALEQGRALVRIDLLPGDTAAAGNTSARISLPGQKESEPVEILGPAPVADPQMQGVSYLALAQSTALPAGAAVRVALPGEGKPAERVVAPRDAVIYHQGSAWVFVLEEHDTFERKRVTPGRVIGTDQIAIVDGLEPDALVATTGAQQLLAAELLAGATGEP